MNIYFFLDHPDLDNSLDIFNFPPNPKFCIDELKDIYPYAFFRKGKVWEFISLDKIKKNDSCVIKKSDLPNIFQSESVFISFSLKPNNFKESLENLNYMNSSPQWRANTKIFSDFTSASYQGEYPGSILSKNISLVSCSPMIQNKFETYFYLINLTNNPEKKKFGLEIMNTNLKVLETLECYTNTINLFNLNSLSYKFTDKFYVFKSQYYGGVPLYFTKSDNKSMGIEHTHPPSEYIFMGDRNHFQKLKKKYWLSEKNI